MNAPLLAWMGGLASLLAATGSLVVEDDVVAGPDLAPPAAHRHIHQGAGLDLEKLLLQAAYLTDVPLEDGWEWRQTLPERAVTGDRLAGLHFSF